MGKIRTLLRESGSAESLKLQRTLLAMEGSAPLFVTVPFTRPSFFEGLVLRLVVLCPDPPGMRLFYEVELSEVCEGRR